MNISLFKMLLLLFFLAVSQNCTNPVVLPLEEEKLVQVLADVHFAEAALNHLNHRKKEKSAELYYQQIFEIQDVKQEDFDSSMAILRKNTDLMHQVYTKVMDEMDRRKAKLED